MPPFGRANGSKCTTGPAAEAAVGRGAQLASAGPLLELSAPCRVGRSWRPGAPNHGAYSASPQPPNRRGFISARVGFAPMSFRTTPSASLRCAPERGYVKAPAYVVACLLPQRALPSCGISARPYAPILPLFPYLPSYHATPITAFPPIGATCPQSPARPAARPLRDGWPRAQPTPPFSATCWLSTATSLSSLA